MNARIRAELELLRQNFSEVGYEHHGGMHWFCVGPLRTPAPWSPETVSVAFAVTEGHPGTPPYGFFVPAALTLNGTPPAENGPPAPPPFPGNWRFLSWQAEGWVATADILTGSNLWGWVRSFPHRLKEGL